MNIETYELIAGPALLYASMQIANFYHVVEDRCNFHENKLKRTPSSYIDDNDFSISYNKYAKLQAINTVLSNLERKLSKPFHLAPFEKLISFPSEYFACYHLQHVKKKKIL